MEKLKEEILHFIFHWFITSENYTFVRKDDLIKNDSVEKLLLILSDNVY